jgi:hypothetical protein
MVLLPFELCARPAGFLRLACDPAGDQLWTVGCVEDETFLHFTIAPETFD